MGRKYFCHEVCRPSRTEKVIVENTCLSFVSSCFCDKNRALDCAKMPAGRIAATFSPGEGHNTAGEAKRVLSDSKNKDLGSASSALPFQIIGYREREGSSDRKTYPKIELVPI